MHQNRTPSRTTSGWFSPRTINKTTGIAIRLKVWFQWKIAPTMERPDRVHRRPNYRWPKNPAGWRTIVMPKQNETNGESPKWFWLYFFHSFSVIYRSHWPKSLTKMFAIQPFTFSATSCCIYRHALIQLSMLLWINNIGRHTKPLSCANRHDCLRSHRPEVRWVVSRSRRELLRSTHQYKTP